MKKLITTAAAAALAFALAAPVATACPGHDKEKTTAEKSDKATTTKTAKKATAKKTTTTKTTKDVDKTISKK